jgi:hypothetical protein
MSQIEVTTSVDSSRIIELFRLWQAAQRAADAMPGDLDEAAEAAYAAAIDHADGFVKEISAEPAIGLVGFVVKVFLYIHGVRRREPSADLCPDPCAISGISESEAEDTNTLMMRSILADAARFVPELSLLVARPVDGPPIPRPLSRAELRLVEFMCELPGEYHNPERAEEARRLIAVEEAKLSPVELLRDARRRAMIVEVAREILSRDRDERP